MVQVSHGGIIPYFGSMEKSAFVEGYRVQRVRQ